MASRDFDIEVSGKAGGGLTVPDIKRKAAAILKAAGWKKASLSILLASDREIRKINKEHLGHDYATDVISFGQLDEEGSAAVSGEKPFLGDIVISLDTTRRQAREYGNPFKYEFYFYLCHGILHIAGFEDTTAAERARMHRIQESILQDAGIVRGVAGKARKTDRRRK